MSITQNVLVVHTGPDYWWVKIADFGISKRVIDGHTALQTQMGTPAFQAPEILGFVLPNNDRLDESYTNAVDIWSIGVITFFILTQEILFPHTSHLNRYVTGNPRFRPEFLSPEKLGDLGFAFVTTLMASKPEDRPGAKECSQHPWLNCLVDIQKTRRYYFLSIELTSFLVSYVVGTANISVAVLISQSLHQRCLKIWIPILLLLGAPNIRARPKKLIALR